MVAFERLECFRKHSKQLGVEEELERLGFIGLSMALEPS